jgi:hypothetical protein
MAENHSMLPDLLKRYCCLAGIEITETLTTIECTMPSGVILTVYDIPCVNFIGARMVRYYGEAEYPWRTCRRFFYLDDHDASYLMQKLREKISELEILN